MTDIKLDTRFGEQSIDPAQIITFPKGIPGFEKSTRWKLFHEVDDQGNWTNGVVVHLQSVDDGAVALPLTDPTLFGLNYDMLLSDSEAEELGLEDPNDIMVLMALSSRDDIAGTASGLTAGGLFANITAPILINTKSRIGMQKTLNGKDARIEFKPAMPI